VNWRPLLTLPNLLSLARFPLAAGFAIADRTPARVALLITASATDMLDGWIARHPNRSTRWGALIDPVADKVFVLVALTAFLARGTLSMREYGIILSRDIAIAIGFLIATRIPAVRPADFRARWSGKVVTGLQLLAVLLLCLAPASLRWLVVAIALASIWAIADYTLALAVVRARRLAGR
jgi:CDP-diacylglycerol--glycerol-3-phosphate 3-phosphatidyltransferase/cardiolipin synthase